MEPISKDMRCLTLQMGRIAGSVHAGRGFVAKPASAAVLAMIVGLTAYSAAIATTASGAAGLPDAGVPADRISVAVKAMGGDYPASGGLTVMEKTHPGCGAAPNRLIQDVLHPSAAPGGKGDRLATSVCELIVPADQER